MHILSMDNLQLIWHWLPNMCDNLANSLVLKITSSCNTMPSMDANQQYHVYGKTLKTVRLDFMHASYAVITVKQISDDLHK